MHRSHMQKETFERHKVRVAGVTHVRGVKMEQLVLQKDLVAGQLPLANLAFFGGWVFFVGWKVLWVGRFF